MKRFAVCILALTSCQAEKQSAGICIQQVPEGTYEKPKAATNFAEAYNTASNCVERSAASLVGAPDNSTTVANAAVASCAIALDLASIWATREQIESDKAALRKDLYGAALYVVVHNRARGCKFPDVK